MRIYIYNSLNLKSLYCRKEKEDLQNRLQLEQKKFELDERQRHDGEKQKLVERLRKEVEYLAANGHCNLLQNSHFCQWCSQRYR